MKFPESAIMHQYLDGFRGIEIGAAAHNTFGLDTINVDVVQHSDQTYSGRSQLQMVGHIEPVDIIADAYRLPFEDKAFDFVISSHVVEHLYSPVHALLEWQRVASYYIAVIIPDKHRCGEGDKETTIDQLWAAYDTFDFSPEQMEDKHWTFWDLDLFLQLCKDMNLNVVYSNPTDDKVGNGFTVIINLK